MSYRNDDIFGRSELYNNNVSGEDKLQVWIIDKVNKSLYDHLTKIKLYHNFWENQMIK